MSNRLSNEKSPYLLQHKDNPVDWYPWGDEAFARAKQENKLIFLSIGYSTCYWCHVMEKDSFETTAVAEVLNRDFVSIKVDREERPDVDAIHMDAVLAINGHGGWPMSVFLTPDLRPIYGGTFYYRAQFIPLLTKLNEVWEATPELLLANANKIVEYLNRDIFSDPEVLDESILHGALAELAKTFDRKLGGFGRAPKFPQAGRLSLLLRIHKRYGDNNALSMAVETFERMARGGIYDQLGGGFHRYSTDAGWLVPHFEKMLYDNALLAWSYLEAFQVTKRPFFATIARETLDYVLREMTSPEGGFFSAQDAGEVGREGEFYVWRESDIRELTTDGEFEIFAKTYGVTPGGNFEHGTNVLHLSDEATEEMRLEPRTVTARAKLLAHRATRIPPHTDDKVLTAWNGLMIAAMAKGYQVLRDERYLSAAQRAARFIQEHLMTGSELLRRYRDGEAGIRAGLDEYAFFVQGLLALYETDFDLHWMKLACQLQEKQDELFWDSVSGGYFSSPPDDPSLIVRKKEFLDNATPSGNGIAALNLLQLYDFTFKEPYKARAQDLLRTLSGDLVRYPSAFATAAMAVDYLLAGPCSLIVVDSKGSETERAASSIGRFVEEVWARFLPHKALIVGTPSDDAVKLIPQLYGKETLNSRATFYICKNHSCELPTNEVEAALETVWKL